MKEKPQVIHRGKLIYLLYGEKVIVKVSPTQWVSYNQYDNFNRQGITLFKQKILKSDEDEYGLPADQMSLAVECGIKGTSTRPVEYEE